jgi:hypothetical protein
MPPRQNINHTFGICAKEAVEFIAEFYCLGRCEGRETVKDVEWL